MMYLYFSVINLAFSGFSVVNALKDSIKWDPPVLTTGNVLKIERNFISSGKAQLLYDVIMRAAVPGPRDSFHENLLAIHGDAGERKRATEPTKQAELVTQFRSIINQTDVSNQGNLESGILRVEHLNDRDYHKVKMDINEFVRNTVLEDQGTIHAYMSRPHSAALANHTDTTDIFVLHLVGAKEWLFCQEQERPPFLGNGLRSRSKLDKCTTYNKSEIGNMDCKRETLYPGDALYLPKRVVHSARATDAGMSAHLTFGFSDNVCSEQKLGSNLKESNSWWTTSSERFLQSTCDSSDGGTSCDELCDGSCCNCECDYWCDCSCDMSVCDGCCDSSCDGCCDSDCDSYCDASCDVCPEKNKTNIGAIVGSIIVVLFLGAGIGVLIWWFKCRAKQHSSVQAKKPPVEKGETAPAYDASETAREVECVEPSASPIVSSMPLPKHGTTQTYVTIIPPPPLVQASYASPEQASYEADEFWSSNSSGSDETSNGGEDELDVKTPRNLGTRLAPVPHKEDDSWDNSSSDDETWSVDDENKTVVQMESHSTTKPDGKHIDTTVKTTTHRDKTTSTIKTVKSSKTTKDGSTKIKTTVTKVDKDGNQTIEKKIQVK